VIEPSGNPPGPPRALRMPLKTPVASDFASDAIKSTRLLRARRYLQRGRSISSILGSVVTRTRNVSEYLLVLALCLVTGNIASSASRRYLVYSEADFEVFRPAGATHCADGG